MNEVPAPSRSHKVVECGPDWSTANWEPRTRPQLLYFPDSAASSRSSLYESWEYNRAYKHTKYTHRSIYFPKGEQKQCSYQPG